MGRHTLVLLYAHCNPGVSMELSHHQKGVDRPTLIFDTAAGPGSPEHYYHLLHGYLLPAAHFLNTCDKPPKVLNMRSCGPVMDTIVHEFFSWLDADVRLVDPNSADYLHPRNPIILPRWERIVKRAGQVRLFKTLLGSIDSEPQEAEIQHLLSVRTAIIEHLMQGTVSTAIESEEHDKGEVLLLRRSPEPAYYAADGTAEIPGYGAERRQLLSLEETALQLRDLGLRTRIFEPGAATLEEQVRAFHAAAGVIGIRGAELANIVWMRPQARVIAIAPLKILLGRPLAPQHALSWFLDVHYLQVPVFRKYVKLSADRLYRAYRRE
ncbi:MAG: glycosyltransferase 61 family protein [Pseudomonadota bacterium]